MMSNDPGKKSLMRNGVGQKRMRGGKEGRGKERREGVWGEGKRRRDHLFSAIL